VRAPTNAARRRALELSAARVEAAVVGGLAALVLALSRLLDPALLERTPPWCLFRVLTTLPCPFCGMTRAFALMAHDDVGAAFRHHVLGPPAYVLTWVALFAAGYAFATDQSPLPALLRTRTAARILVAVIGAGWAVNIVMHVVGW
jgi:hypothetical protein